MLYWYFILYILLLFQISDSTLSASDRKKKEPKQKQPKKVDDFKKRFEEDIDTFKELKSYDDDVYKFEKSERSIISGASLAFITPWNGGGYNNALKAAKKLTHVAPVWFEITEPDNDEFPCKIQGTHNIKRDWINNIRKKNPEIKIVPRFIFDGWKSHAKIDRFFMSDEAAFHCGQLLVDFVSRNEFDGAVIELYAQLMVFTGGKGEMVILEILEQWNNLMKKVKKEVVIPLFPPRQTPFSDNRAMHPEVLRQFVDNADYVMLMTYDYSSPTPTPAGVAPIDWVDLNVQYALDSIEGLDTSKLMLGLNFYGYFYKQGNQKPGLVRDFIRLMKEDETLHLYWDKINEEHALIQEGTRTIMGYFPTRKSIKSRIELANRYGIGFGIWEAGQSPLNYFEVL